MAKKVALIHTGFALVEVLKNLFGEIIPQAELINILDDSLLREVLKEGSVTKPVIERMISYYKSAEYYNVDVILNVCSSVGEVADIARMIINTPIIKIDDAMTETAVKKAASIGVAATLKTTLDPTCRLLEKKAEGIGKKITITRTLCPGAFEELMNGNAKKHDEIVLEEVKKLSDKVDIVVLAQGSMARLADYLDEKLLPRVLSSPRSGVMEVKRILGI